MKHQLCSVSIIIQMQNEVKFGKNNPSNLSKNMSTNFIYVLIVRFQICICVLQSSMSSYVCLQSKYKLVNITIIYNITVHIYSVRHWPGGPRPVTFHVLILAGPLGQLVKLLRFVTSIYMKSKIFAFHSF